MIAADPPKPDVDQPEQNALVPLGQDAGLQFLALLGHEIKAPINAVTGMAEIMLLDKSPLPERHRAYLAEILAGGRHVLDVIDRVLTMVRLERGQYPLQASLVDLDELTRQCMRALEPDAQAAGVTLVHEAPAHLMGLVDGTALRQVLTNILSNAVKYSQPGGLVRVKLSGVDERNIWQIEDYGIGIALNDVTRIFKPFERAVAADRPLLEGLGLGLPVAKTLVDQMGGRLALTSQLGQGTQVVIELPKFATPSTLTGEESKI